MGLVIKIDISDSDFTILTSSNPKFDFEMRESLLISKFKPILNNDISSTPLNTVCTQASVPIAPDKTFRPSTTITFAAIELDSIRSEAHLPQEKVTKCVELITAFLTRKKVQLQEL